MTIIIIKVKGQLLEWCNLCRLYRSEHAKAMIKILQGSAVTQTVLGGLTYILQLQISCSVCVLKRMEIR